MTSLVTGPITGDGGELPNRANVGPRVWPHSSSFCHVYRCFFLLSSPHLYSCCCEHRPLLRSPISVRLIPRSVHLPSSIIRPLSSVISRPGTTPLVTAALGNHLPWLAYTDTYCILHPASPIPRPLLLYHLFLPLFFSFHLPLHKASGKSSCVS